MIYAKCIQKKYIVDNIEEFEERQKRGEHVYCVGQTTKDKSGLNTLDCVPVNVIFDCLRYGDYMAIIDMQGIGKEYVQTSGYQKCKISSSEQKIIKIMSLNDKKTIDFIFDEVGNPDLINTYCIYHLEDEIQNYINKKK